MHDNPFIWTPLLYHFSEFLHSCETMNIHIISPILFTKQLISVTHSVLYCQCFARGIKLWFPYCLLWVDCSQKRNKQKKTVSSVRPSSWKNQRHLAEFPQPNFPPLPRPGTVKCLHLGCCEHMLVSHVLHIPFKELQVVQRTTTLGQGPRGRESCRVLSTGRECRKWVSLSAHPQSSTVLHPSAYPGKVLSPA